MVTNNNTTELKFTPDNISVTSTNSDESIEINEKAEISNNGTQASKTALRKNTTKMENGPNVSGGVHFMLGGGDQVDDESDDQYPLKDLVSLFYDRFFGDTVNCLESLKFLSAVK